MEQAKGGIRQCLVFMCMEFISVGAKNNVYNFSTGKVPTLIPTFINIYAHMSEKFKISSSQIKFLKK